MKKYTNYPIKKVKKRTSDLPFSSLFCLEKNIFQYFNLFILNFYINKNVLIIFSIYLILFMIITLNY